MANLRFRNARDSADLLGQVSTPPAIAALLAESIQVTPGTQPKVLDLGAGQGALANAIALRHRDARAVLVEIDRKSVASLQLNKLARFQIVQADVLAESWNLPFEPNVIVSNPPYGSIALRSRERLRLSESELDIPFNGEWVRGDAAFVVRAWGLSSANTHLGLIVASPIIRGSAYKAMRQRFVRELRNLCVTQLCETTFRNVEVRTFIISGQRAVDRKRSVLLRKADSSGAIVDEMSISSIAAVASLDIDFHKALDRLGLTATPSMATLATIGAQITRGSRSMRDYERLGLNAFHTTDFPDSPHGIVLRGSSKGFHSAAAGDMLIPRVGTRCLGRQARVLKGAGLFTDCVYRLSVTESDRARVWKTLNSSFGIDWRLANAAGSCAKHLTIETLSDLPLMP